ncbi:MAG: T9SS type A sorting domain-containing protein [Ignavibacteriales bacterium]|nr:T9SS type A sorting domain-containing protein [Ignavibacteriales bacterium]
MHNNTKYFWRVAARNSLILYRYSNTYGFTTQLAKPVLLSPPNNSTNIAGSAGIQWNNVDGAQKYHLQVSKNFLFTQFAVNDSNLFTNSYTAVSLENSKNYYWRVRAGNQYGFGTYAEYFKFQAGTSAVSDELNGLPDDFKLLNNYPNPFNPGTVILFTVPLTERPVKVLIRVFDVMGRELVTLLNEEKEAGYHTVSWDAGGLASGVYLCKMEAMGKRLIIKMLLSK